MCTPPYSLNQAEGEGPPVCVCVFCGVDWTGLHCTIPFLCAAPITLPPPHPSHLITLHTPTHSDKQLSKGHYRQTDSSILENGMGRRIHASSIYLSYTRAAFLPRLPTPPPAAPLPAFLHTLLALHVVPCHSCHVPTCVCALYMPFYY